MFYLDRNLLDVGQYIIGCALDGQKYSFECTTNCIPIGTVDFCEDLMVQPPKPDYYPKFLSKFITRDIQLISDYTNLVGYIKPATKYKLFETYFGDCSKVRGPVWVNQPIRIINEYRFYIIKGEIWDAFWYAGKDENAPVPRLDFNWPKTYYGAVDFAVTPTGLELLEAHHPYAVGWYGKDYRRALKFLEAGWKYMVDIGCVNGKF